MLCGISACQNGGGVNPIPKAGLIVGKWNLQQEKFMQYIDGIKKVDTSYTTSSLNISKAQFNSDGTYNCASHSISGNGSSSLAGGTIVVASQDSTYGTYTLNGSALNLSSTLAGFSNAAFFGSITASTISTTNVFVSRSFQVSELTSSKLTVHLELMYTNTNTSAVTQTFKDEEDLYYSK